MILDKELMMSNKQALTTAASSTDVIDLGAAGDAYSSLWLVVNIDTAITGTLGIALETDSDVGFATANVTLVSLAAANARPAGNVYKARLPLGCKRFLRMAYTGTVSAGVVSAFLVQDVKSA